jgi:hypothetical protein
MVLEIVPNEKLLSSFPKFKGRQNYYALIHAFNPEDLAKLKDPGAAAPGNPAAPKAKK